MPTVQKPRLESSASSRALMLRLVDLLDIRTRVPMSAKGLYLTHASKVVSGRHSLTATNIAKASHKVLCAESPAWALTWRRSCLVRGVA